MKIVSARGKNTRRRGSTILLAVGVLATLAIVALVYLASVGSERASATRAAQDAPFDRAGEKVRDEIGALLAADLFGNKITTPDVPQYRDQANFTTRIWPRMFEDGEYSDYPFVDGAFSSTTFNLNRAWDPPSTRAVLDPTGTNAPAAAPSRDDAWLSTTEPFFDRNTPENSFWPQVSNLRDGYRWRADLDRWVRADGRFADLAQWFLTNRAQNSGRGDPEADLSPDNIEDFGASVSTQRNTPERGVAQRVFGYQINSLREIADNDSSFGSLNQADPNNGPRPLERADERFWADTDGDLRPDARWQTLDALDGLFGLKWVVAARVIDNSALINVNTAMDSGAPDMSPSASTPQVNPPPGTNAGLYVTDGRTPADVDLYRLLFLANLGPTQNVAPPPNTGAWLDIVRTGLSGPVAPSYYDFGSLPAGAPANFPYRAAFRNHLDHGLSLTGLVNELYSRASVQPPYGLGTDINWRFTREERAAAYRAFLSSRGAGLSGSAVGRAYPLADELDLRAFWASNDDRTLSDLERRLDFGYLPGQASTWPPGSLNLAPAERLSGPLRASRAESVERSFQQVQRRASGPRIGRPSVLEIEDDVRHLLTTYNGVSDVSPVPVLNPAKITLGPPQMLNRPVYEGRYATGKVRVADFPKGIVGASSAEHKTKADLVRRSFEAFTWALAPLATNEPVMSPLRRQDVLNARIAQGGGLGHDYHYGGGALSNGGYVNGPALRMGEAAQAAGAPNADLGASYAILRAAALAVNLADAADNEDAIIPDPTTPTREQPTVVRLFNIPEVDPSPAGRLNANSPNLTSLQPFFDAGVIPMGVRFSQGDLADPNQPSPMSDTVRLPERYVGPQDRGVTIIGLDRQPFLMEAWTLAYYDADPAGSAGVQINPNDPARQLGSIIAVEIGNPWPEPLDLGGYRVRIQTVLGYVEMPLTGTIGVGRSRIVWGAQGRSSATEWTQVLDAWKGIVAAQTAGSVDFDLSANAPLSLWPIGSVNPVTPLGPVVFQSIARPVGNETGVAAVTLWTTAGGIDVLVDRIWKRQQTDAAFPATFRGNVDIPPPPQPNPAPPTPLTTYSGRIVAVSDIRRPTEPGANGSAAGFPAWVIENAERNEIRMEPANAGAAGAAQWYQHWWTNAPGPIVSPPPEPEELITGSAAFGYPTGGLQDLLGQPKESLDNLPAFQFFVPNRPPVRAIGSPTTAQREEWDRLGSLASTSELFMISTFAHMYVHGAIDLSHTPQVHHAALPALMPPMFGMVDPATLGGYWRTVSEQLGDPAELTYDAGSATTPGTVPNPYLGVLDPSRYVLRQMGGTAAPTGMGAVNNLPDALAVPLAIRILDAFEVLDLPDGFAQGRMNINTAPLKALRMLPFVAPWYEKRVSSSYNESIADATLNGPNSRIAQNLDRGALMVDYRDGVGDFSTPAGARSRTSKLAHPGLRTIGEPVGANQTSLGFHYVGEAALLQQWHGGAGTPTLGAVGAFSTGAPYDTFAELALSSGTPLNAGLSTSPPGVGVAEVDSVLDVRANAAGGATTRTYDPIDDAEERLAIFRAISNIATARSDVYTAWFVVRAYDPRRIEAIEIPVGANAQERASLLNLLEPTHESRWVAVFDRSNVRRPTDRPKVLLFTRLPR